MARVIWLTGISNAGKTTLALKLKEKLEKSHLHVELLDGNIVRDFFMNDLTFSRRDRILNVKRIAFAAKLVAKNGTHVIVSNIAPYYEVRDFIRKNIEEYIQIYVKVSIDEAMKRDVKGNYGRFQKGEIKNVIGLDDPYDIPRNPHLIVDTEKETVEESLNKILDHLQTQGV